jgi:hypothetical protein
MTPDRRIRFNGFKCSTVAHTTAGLWRHPNSQSHRYKELSFWTELAKTRSSAGSSIAFSSPTPLGVLDVYRGSPDQTLSRSIIGRTLPCGIGHAVAIALLNMRATR